MIPFFCEDIGELKADEYLKDGVIYCKLCNTPREFVSPDKSFRVRACCVCQQKKQLLQEKKAEEEKRLKIVEDLQSASLMGERYKNVSFQNTETGENATFDTAFIRCKKYCEADSVCLDKGYGIFLYGDTGTGKTRLTACMANDLIKKSRQVLFTNFGEISQTLKSTFGKSDKDEAFYIKRFTNIDFLFIDDLGTERVQAKDGDLWLQEKVFEVLNKRYNNKKPTIFTSNYSLKELITDKGWAKHTVDRIGEMSNAILKVEGKSYRSKARETQNLPF